MTCEMSRSIDDVGSERTEGNPRSGRAPRGGLSGGSFDSTRTEDHCGSKSRAESNGNPCNLAWAIATLAATAFEFAGSSAACRSINLTIRVGAGSTRDREIAAFSNGRARASGRVAQGGCREGRKARERALSVPVIRSRSHIHGDDPMRLPWKTPASPSKAPRRSQRIGFTWDALEERTVLSHVGGFHHLHAAAQVANVSSTATTHSGHDSATASSSNSTLSAAQQTLRTDVQTILSASGTTVGELTAIQTTFQTLKADGLTPTSQSALSTFENSLVTSSATGTTLTDSDAPGPVRGVVHHHAHAHHPADDRPHRGV